jgi:hypothetical protein
MASSIPFWDSNPGGYEGSTFLKEPEDVLLLDGKQVPGLPMVHCIRHTRIDIKKAPGADGASTFNLGYDPSDVNVEIVVWTPAQWTELQKLLAEVIRLPHKQSPKTKPDARRRANLDERPRALTGRAHKILTDLAFRAHDATPVQLATGQFGLGDSRVENVLNALSESDAKVVFNALSATPQSASRGQSIQEEAAITIEHPRTRFLHINKIVVRDLESPTEWPGQGGQARMVRLRCVQFMEMSPRSVMSKIKGVFKVTQAREHVLKPKNLASTPPSRTEALPSLPPKPAQGEF